MHPETFCTVSDSYGGGLRQFLGHTVRSVSYKKNLFQKLETHFFVSLAIFATLRVIKKNRHKGAP